MRKRWATPNELKTNFDRCLHELALKGEPIPTETGLAPKVYDALMDIASQWPNVSPTLIVIARKEFQHQLDVTQDSQSDSE
jgi:hypothetical protein